MYPIPSECTSNPKISNIKHAENINIDLQQSSNFTIFSLLCNKSILHPLDTAPSCTVGQTWGVTGVPKRKSTVVGDLCHLYLI